MMERARKYFKSVSGLGTVPGFIALSLWIASLLALWFDTAYPEYTKPKALEMFHTNYETARSVLSTVATASVTTLGLVYSIVLVVFTTAAGNIGPRLLQRFTSDRANQFTAGLFGGTFLFSLTVLHQTDENFVPAISIAMTFFLAGLSVLQLIYFVHRASESVTIDREVAEIATQMEQQVNDLVRRAENDEYSAEVPKPNNNGSVIKAFESGYISNIDAAALTEVAQKNDSFLTLQHELGAFVVPGQILAQSNSELDKSDLEELEEVVRGSISVSSNRSPDSDVEFSINLLLEIALRALSPGVNDTYTAITCVDRISSALVEPVSKGLRDQIRADDDGVPRLRIPGLSLQNLLNTSFHPLRRAAKSNVLMTQKLIDALGRLYEIADEDGRKVLSDHGRLINESAKRADLLEEDAEFLIKRCSKLLHLS